MVVKRLGRPPRKDPAIIREGKPECVHVEFIAYDKSGDLIGCCLKCSLIKNYTLLQRRNILELVKEKSKRGGKHAQGKY